MNLRVTKIGHITGIVSNFFFLACILWGAILVAPELKDFHYNLIRVIYPGYSTTVLGFIIGLVESYVYGWLIGAGFARLCNKICKE